MKNNEELFSRADSLGSMNSSQIGSYLTEIGDLDAAAPFMPGVSPQSLFGPKEPWRHTGLILGFIAQLAPGDAKTSAIIGAGDLQGDKGLVGKRIKITLDKFYVRKYPGKGDHSILCEFAGKNQVEGETEELRLALRFDAADKTSVAISGAPIFIGVTVGPNGISFEGRSINVRSSTDDAIVAALDDQAFKSGLSLLMTAQPALKPLASLATAAVKAVCSKSGNRQVHNYKLGLDFGAGATSARLRHGSYVVVQSDDAHVWTWDAFEWNRDSMNLQYKADPTRELDFNFMVFGVTEYLESLKHRRLSRARASASSLPKALLARIDATATNSSASMTRSNSIELRALAFLSDGPLRIDWLGNIVSSRRLGSRVRCVRVVCSPWNASTQWGGGSNTAALQKTADIPVAFLRMLRVGDIWHNGVRVGSAPLIRRTFENLEINGQTASTVPAGARADSSNAMSRYELPFSQFAAHIDHTASFIARVQCPDGSTLLVPSLELVRFYFGASGTLVSKLFSGPLDAVDLFTYRHRHPTTKVANMDLAAGLPAAAAAAVSRAAFDPIAFRVIVLSV